MGTIEVQTGKINWLQIPGDPRQNYLPRMQWIGQTSQLLVQQLNRKQNKLTLWVCKAEDGVAKSIYTETEETWLDILHNDVTMPWKMRDLPQLKGGKEFMLTSEKDGWRHLYKMSIDGKQETLLTPGEADVARYYQLDEANGYVYINASPDNSTQRYLYRVPLDGSGKWERLTPGSFTGVNRYDISPNGRFARHTFSHVNAPEQSFLISLPKHQILDTLVSNDDYRSKVAELNGNPAEFFEVTTEDGVTMDGWMIRPPDFDSTLQYPVFLLCIWRTGEPNGG